jgi:hypothetical protein
MAKKQSRRAISFSREVYEATKRAAEREDKSIAHFVTDVLRAAGVEFPTTSHARLVDVKHMTRRRHGKPKAQPPKRREGAIRRALGDAVADWAGEES